MRRKEGPAKTLAGLLTSTPTVQWRKLNIVQYRPSCDDNGQQPPVIGHATVCIDPQRKRISFSFCSPKDHYSKIYGRWLATVRLNAPENRVRKCWRTFENNLTTEQIKDALIDIARVRGIQWILSNVKSLDQIR